MITTTGILETKIIITTIIINSIKKMDTTTIMNRMIGIIIRTFSQIITTTFSQIRDLINRIILTLIQVIMDINIKTLIIMKLTFRMV